MPIVKIQRRMMELGRIRLGEKGSRGEPKKLTTFRLTSASQELLEQAARLYGGTVRPWANAPDEGYFELYTETSTLRVILPPTFSDRDGTPTAPYSQWFELWSAGGCQRRCDGVVETLSGKPCLCEEPGAGPCKVTTRISVILEDVPGIGVWRLESHGWNAATILPGTMEVLQQAAGGGFVRAVLRLEPRTSVQEGQTRKFVVPVLDTPGVTISELAAGEGQVAINAPSPPGPKPALGPAPTLGEAERFDTDDPPLGTPPPPPPGEPPAGDEVDETAKITQADRRMLFGRARDVYGADTGEAKVRELVGQVRGTESTGDMTVGEWKRVLAMIEETSNVEF
jgi:hypothetical protein